MRQPVIIQGGMGAGISHWGLARTVSRLGQLGVVSGTALEQLLARRLQDGDPGEHMRRALERFPDHGMAERVWREYYIPGGRRSRQGYHPPPVQQKDDPRSLVELRVVANFVEVYLARAGHDGPVGINYLEKIQIPHLASLYGAMLAGVDYVRSRAGAASAGHRGSRQPGGGRAGRAGPAAPAVALGARPVSLPRFGAYDRRHGRGQPGAAILDAT